MTQRNSEKTVQNHEKVQKQSSVPAAELQTESAQSFSQNLWGEGEFGSQAGSIARMATSQQQAMLKGIGQVQGNQHVQRLINTMHQGKSRVQAKMEVSEPEDSSEIEAENVATQVMNSPMPTPAEEENTANVQREPSILHRQAESTGGEMPSDTAAKVDQLGSGGKQLPGEEANFFESRMGSDFSGVNIRADQQAADTAQELNARAFTVGNTIAFNKGEYQPGTGAGRRLLAHELTHVVQQGAAPPVKDQSVATSIKRSSQIARIQRAISFDDAKAAIEKACKGWGTDEKAIYHAIRECSDRPRLQNDPTVKQLLDDELSGHDRWKADLLFQYGNEANYPKGLQEIWDATKGWGTDENKILQMLQKLTPAELALLNAASGLNAVLMKELGGKDLQAVQDLFAGQYAQALADHQANVAAVKAEITAMRADPDPAISNTAEWLEPVAVGGVAKNELYVLSKTHDSAARVAAHGKSNSMEAYFGGDKLYPDNSGDYDAHVDSNRNIEYIDGSWLGAHLDRKIWVYDPISSLASLRGTLVHESQHDADRHDKEPGADKAYKSPEESWVRYKTEFRAYWVANMTSPTVSGSAAAPFDNQRQKDIFDHLYNSPTYSVWLKPNYDNDTKVYGEGFKKLVHNYKTPEGVNLINSPRIDDFFLKLEACKKSDTDLTKSPLKELEVAANALDAQDRAHVNSAEALRLQEMAKDHLEDAVLAHIATIVNGGVAPAWVNVNISSKRAAIEKAGKGWGTDEGAIYKAIESATPAERNAMKTDPTIRRILFTELSGHDLWKAQFMLEYGAQNQWPQVVKDLWEATVGWGTDEKAIRDALQKLTRPQVEALAKVEGINEMLGAELSGVDKTTTDELMAGNYADVIAAHQQDMAAVAQAIQAGLADPDPNKQALYAKLQDPSKALVYAMTKTHNSAARVAYEKKAGTDAYFGADAAYPATNSSYDSHPSQNKGIRFIAAGANSQTEGMNLYLYEARNIALAARRTVLEIFAGTLA